MKKRWSALPAFAGAVLLLVSCYPGDVTNIQQLDVVVTTHDDSVSFSTFSTYVVLDSVVHIDLIDNDNDSLLTRENDELILSRVVAGIQGMGYVEEMDPDNNTPDVVLLVGALGVTKRAYISYPWYPYWGWGWGGGWGCCGPGYGWGYPGGVTTVTWDVGTLLITMLDPDAPSTGNDLAGVIWLAGINGILSSSASATTARITSLIDQAFTQSPYLSPNANLPN